MLIINQDLRVLSAMEERINETMKLEFKNEQNGLTKKPLFMSLTAKDIWNWETSAKDGDISVYSPAVRPRRKCRGEIRVGSRDGGCSKEIIEPIFLFGNLIGFRREIWREANEAFHDAVKKMESTCY